MSRLIIIKALIIFILIVTAIASIQLSLGQKYNSKSVGSITMEVIGSDSTTHQNETNVTVIKSIEGIGSGLRLKYKIITPKIDDFHFVLALDSSASLKNCRDSEQAKAVIDAVPKFIKRTQELYPKKNFSISIVSWDDDIDFAYKDLKNNFNNKDPKNAKLVNITTILSDIKNNVFGAVNSSAYYYRCEGKDHTNISKALEASISILDNNRAEYYHRTSNFTILVTGESEFSECDIDLINKMREKGYYLYAVQMEPNENESEMLSHLKSITGNENRVLSCHAIGEELKNELGMHLDEALRRAVSEPAAENVKIVESFYSYIIPADEGAMSILGLHNNRSNVIIDKGINNSPLTICLPYGLPADNVTEITLDAKLALNGLPVSVSENSKPVIFYPSNASIRSNISYTWLKKFPISANLTSNTIDIQSNPSEDQNRAVNPSKNLSNNGLALINLISIMTIFLILRTDRKG